MDEENLAYYQQTIANLAIVEQTKQSNESIQERKTMQLFIAIIAFLIAWIIATAIANDPACNAVAHHNQPLKFIEQLLLFCWL